MCKIKSNLKIIAYSFFKFSLMKITDFKYLFDNFKEQFQILKLWKDSFSNKIDKK